MRGGGILLISMPWEELGRPSIQLGILLSVLEREGIPAEARSLNLDFMEYCASATADRPEVQRLSIASYGAVIEWSREVSLGDWVFSRAATSPRAAPPDEPYLAFLRQARVSEEDIATALAFRALVPSFLDRVAAEIAADAPAIVGFSTAFNQTLPSLALAARLRERLGDSVRILFGGANCQGKMGAALHRAFPVIDVVVRGEGERVLPELVRDLLASRPIRPRPGLCFRDADGRQVVTEEAPGHMSMDEVPAPQYDEYFERLSTMSLAPEILPQVTLFYESARGCWWGERSHCAFCGISDLVMPFRAKSPERVVAELIELAERYGQRRFFFVDYILHHSYFDQVLPRLADSGYDFRIFCETKANLRKDQIRQLLDAGFTRIQAGVESLSTPILKLMRKGVTELQNLRLLKWCAEYGLRLEWNLMYGIPGEPIVEYERMTDLIPSLAHLEPPRLVPLQLDRFSPYDERPGDFGIVPLGPRRDFRFVYPSDCVDAATLAEIVYSFEFRYADGRDPEAYSAPLRDAVRTWQASGRTAIGTLHYRRGPDFLVITDRRPGFEAREYRLGETEARLYLACGDGATADEAWRAVCAPAKGVVTAGLSTEEVEEFLEELVEARLACKADGHYLALALPPAPRASARPRGTELTARTNESAASGNVEISAR